MNGQKRKAGDFSPASPLFSSFAIKQANISIPHGSIASETLVLYSNQCRFVKEET
nr:MAG TPA: hypothetical protein [Caudoviricetes sp.]